MVMAYRLPRLNMELQLSVMTLLQQTTSMLSSWKWTANTLSIFNGVLKQVLEMMISQKLPIMGQIGVHM